MFKLTRFLVKEILQNNFIYSKILKPRTGPPPKIKKWIKKYKNDMVEDILVCREPVNGAVKKLINIISLGKFDKSLKGLRYEDIFHLYIYIKVKNTWFRIEKNEVVTLTKSKKKHTEICLDLVGKNITLEKFMKTGENYQDNFWSYNARNNNCQDFALSLLLGNKIIRKNSKEYKFIKQDAEAIFTSNPGYLDKFGKTVTDIAGIFAILKDPF